MCTQHVLGVLSSKYSYTAAEAPDVGGCSHRYSCIKFTCRGPPPEYGFGTPLYGSCGYTSQKGTEGLDFSNLPFPVDMLAAVANVNDDYPGSCGR